jgi:hypothetical protein
MAAETEDDVVNLLRDSGYWDDDLAWRYYSDDPNNFDRAGNQQRNPEAALVEKVVNSVDANLLRRALEAGLDPRDPAAPHSPREAVAVFYENAEAGAIRAHQGSLAEWTDAQRRDVSRDVTLAVTGSKPEQGFPCVSIADAGEGQAPERLPETILSLSKGIKKGIPFVQGRFNMGGTGALRFCGYRNLQLVVSKRLPSAALTEGVSTAWGFTVVRRDDPTPETRISTYRYLAPVGATEDPRRGGVLSIERETLPIFPEGQKPYSREASWGTLIKLYEFKTRARTHMFRRGGLQERLDILLPGLVLPVRLHECRDYRGEERSFETTLTGLEVRLGEKSGRSENLEEGFPATGDISIRGQELPFTLYAFRADRAQTYKRNEGVLFVLGGQTHAPEPDRFFRRRDVGMSYIAQSLLLVLDCSGLIGRTIEDLFMNSRDRLADEELAREILDELATVVRRHEGLRLLRERRRQADIAGKIAGEKPLQDVLEQILKRSPALARIFLAGVRLSNPFATTEKAAEGPFVGRRHPTYFRFKDHKSGESIRRPASLGQRFRLTFVTDAENDYFRRSVDAGELLMEARLNGSEVSLTRSLNLFNGFAQLNVSLPPEARVGDVLSVRVTVRDASIVDPFVNEATLDVAAEVEPGPGGDGQRRQRKAPTPKGAPQTQPAGIDIPEVNWVYRDEWKRKDFVIEMTEASGMRAVLAGASDDPDAPAQYDFYVNGDNIYLQTELKATKQEPDLVKAKFKNGMALVGLGAIHRANELETTSPESVDGEESVPEPPSGEDLVATATDVVAPILLPMIDGLGALDLDEVDMDTSADAQDLAEALSD